MGSHMPGMRAAAIWGVSGGAMREVNEVGFLTACMMLSISQQHNTALEAGCQTGRCTLPDRVY